MFWKDSWITPLPFFSFLFTSSHRNQASAANANSHTQWQALRLVKLMGYMLTTLPSFQAALCNAVLSFLFSLLRLHRVLVAVEILVEISSCRCCTRGIFRCNMWDLVPWPGIEPRPPALGAWSLNHWTIREVPAVLLKMWPLRPLVSKIMRDSRLKMYIPRPSPELQNEGQGTYVFNQVPS